MISEWLKKERKRLGCTQPDFAAIAGVKKRTIIDWEKGVSSPTAVQLSALFQKGFDVQYILTGVPGYKIDPPSVLETARQQAYIDAVEKAAESSKYENSAHLDEKQAKSVTEFTEKPLTNAKFVINPNLDESNIEGAYSPMQDADTHLPMNEQMLLMAFRSLNDAGKRAALGLISDFCADDEVEPKPKASVVKQKISSKGFSGQQFNAPVGKSTSADTVTINYDKKK